MTFGGIFQIRARVLGGTLAVLALSCGSASASTMQAVYSGTVSYGYDSTNYLGLGTDLTGLAFSATFLFDPDTPGSVRESPSDYDAVYGGDGYGPSITSPSSLATFQLGSQSYSFVPNYAGNATNSPAGGLITHQAQGISNNIDAEGNGSYLYDYFLGQFYNVMGIPLSLYSSFSFPLVDGTSNGQFSTFAYEQSCTPACDQTYSRQIYAQWGATSLNVSAVSPVPLPAGLPLLAVGLGGLGLLGWRKRGRV